jgi:hypothetical protein
MSTLTKPQTSARASKQKRPASLHPKRKAKPDLNAFASRSLAFMQEQFAGRTIADSTPLMDELRAGNY